MKTDEVKHAEREHWGKPLDGIRVLAAEQMQALPYATQLMAHLGADVVKVEHPEHGESGRGANPKLVDTDGREVGATYLRNNLGKKSIGIDLKSDAGRELFLDLVPHFDIVAENFRPGTMGRLGLGYDEISKQDPSVIYLSVSGFGHDPETPYYDWPAYAPIPEAMAGFYEAIRKSDEAPPVLVAGALGDIGSAMFAVIGTLAALRHRERTGLGQQVDICMYDSMIAMADMVPFMASMGVPSFQQGGGGYGIIAGFKASDGYFIIEVIREHQFEKLAEIVGRQDWLKDERLATRASWSEQLETLIRPAIETWARDMTKLEAAHALASNGVAAGPSNTADDLRRDPHVETRNMLIEVPRPDGGDPLLVVGNPVKLSKVAEGPVRRFPSLGHDTDELLRQLLDLDDTAIAELRQAGVVCR